MDVRLRALERDDFGVLASWLREPLVAEWWHDDPSAAALEAQYGPSIDGADPTVMRIAEVDGSPAGLIQWFRLDDEPDYRDELRAAVDVPPGAWSLDYLVGESALRGRGVATAMVRAALAALGAAHVVVPVHEQNSASVAVLERCGFARTGMADLEPDNSAHSRRHVVLARYHVADSR